jgi:transposase
MFSNPEFEGGLKSPFNCSQNATQILERSERVNDPNARHGRGKWYLMQDGASSHMAQATTKFLSDLCLILPGWPPNSPDLNPIEIIWAIMKRRVKRTAPQTKEELINIIKIVWDELGQRILNKLVTSFEERLKLIARVRGRSIS